jgi:gas vesicle protein
MQVLRRRDLMSEQRDQLQPYLETLDAELQAATAAVRQCRFPRPFVDSLLDNVGDVLDDLDDAQQPHDERLQEARQTLRQIARALLGPGDRDPADAIEAAHQIRDAAAVPRDADINALLAEIAAAAAVYARPEYGPKSRWQALRDQITNLQAQLKNTQAVADATTLTVTQLNAAVETERARADTLQDALEKETVRGTADGLRVLQLRDVLNSATWDDTLQLWTLTDDQRKTALDA